MDLFESSDEEDGQTSVGRHLATTLLHPAIVASVHGLLLGKSEATATDMEALGKPELARALRSAVANFKLAQYNEVFPDASRLALLCLNELKRSRGWPHPCWCETMLFSELMAACAELSKAESDAAEMAMQRADRVHILGGHAVRPVTNLFIRLVDPNVRSARRCTTNALDGQPGFIAGRIPGVSDEAPNAALLRHGTAPRSSVLPRLHRPTTAAFYDGAFATNSALLITGLTDAPADEQGEWAAMQNWADLDLLAREWGHRVVPVEVGHHHELGNLEHSDDAPWRERFMTISDLVRDFLAPSMVRWLNRKKVNEELGVSVQRWTRDELPPSERVAYLAQHELFGQLPELQRDFCVPTYCNENGNRLVRVSAWWGTEGTVTPLHFDSYHNILTQVAGYKFVRLYPASQRPNLYVRECDAAAKNSTSSQGNLSSVDLCEDPDLDRYPLIAEAVSCGETVLGPGDSLFIPQGMWHYVRSLSPSMSINFWFSAT